MAKQISDEELKTLHESVYKHDTTYFEQLMADGYFDVNSSSFDSDRNIKVLRTLIWEASHISSLDGSNANLKVELTLKKKYLQLYNQAKYKDELANAVLAGDVEAVKKALEKLNNTFEELSQASQGRLEEIRNSKYLSTDELKGLENEHNNKYERLFSEKNLGMRKQWILQY